MDHVRVPADVLSDAAAQVSRRVEALVSRRVCAVLVVARSASRHPACAGPAPGHERAKLTTLVQHSVASAPHSHHTCVFMCVCVCVIDR